MVGKPKTSEMHGGVGFRMRTEITRTPDDVIRGLAAFDTPAISDQMNRLYTLAPAIKNVVDAAMPIFGPALTVKVYPGDNLMVHKALDLARPGDVVVVDAAGSPLNGVLGDLVSTKARHRGIAGFVVDGYVRDLPGIEALGDFPVFARGVTPVGPLHRGPGEINVPVCAGGVVVQPGDVVVGDRNGVAVVPQDFAAELLDRLRTKQEREAEYNAAVARGDFDNAWVDDTLAEGGVTFD